MRIDRIPFVSRHALRRNLVSSAKGAFPCVEKQSLSLFVAPAFATAVSELDLHETIPSDIPASPISESGRAPSRVLALKGHDARLHLRPARHGGALAFLWRNRVAGPNRFLRELEVTRTLKARGAPVPTPVLVQTRRRRFLTEVCVGSLHEEGTMDLLTFLKQNPPREELPQLARRVASAVRRFHDCGGCHPDLHAGNVLVSIDSAKSKTLVIDLDGAEIRETVSARRRMRELMRLHRSLRKNGLLARVGCPSVADFIERYSEGDAKLARGLLAALPLEKRRELLHVIAWHSQSLLRRRT